MASMSLYTDTPDLVDEAASDPFSSLSTALSLPTNSPAQAAALLTAKEAIEKDAKGVEEICLPLLEAIMGSGDTLLRRWVLECVAFGVGRSHLSMEEKTNISIKALNPLFQTLQESSPSTAILKLTIQCFCFIYPLLFRHICTTRPPPLQTHTTLQSAKSLILSLALSTTSYPPLPGYPPAPRTGDQIVSVGVRVMAWKFAGKVVLVGTRGGGGDPRLQNKTDPNLNMCPADHPLIRPKMVEEEVSYLIGELINTLYTSEEPALLHPLLSLLPPLLRSRPSLSPSLLPSLAAFDPPTTLPPTRLKSIEKTLKVVLVHLVRSGLYPAFAPMLGEGLKRQQARLGGALEREKKEKEKGKGKRVAMEVEGETSAAGAKRARRRSPEREEEKEGPGSGRGVGVEFDVTGLEVEVVREMLIASLEGWSEERLGVVMERFRGIATQGTTDIMKTMALILGPPQPPPLAQPYPSSSTALTAPQPEEAEQDDMLLDPIVQPSGPVEEEELVVRDPLKMMVDEEDEEEMEVQEVVPKEEEEEELGPVGFIDFQLPPPRELDDQARQEMVLNAMKRIWITGPSIQAKGLRGGLMVEEAPVEGEEEPEDDGLERVGRVLGEREVWVLLLSRLASRGIGGEEGVKGRGPREERDRAKMAVCDFIVADFGARSKLATVWLNEEWYNEQLNPSPRGESSYNNWLETLLRAYITNIDGKDKSLTGFLLDLPELPEEVLGMLRGLCETPATAIVGYTTLRDIVMLRPPLRVPALQILLELTTHAERLVRTMAINTVKRWVPDIKPMNKIVVNYALQMVRRLASVKEGEKEDGIEEGEEVEEKAFSPYLPEELEGVVGRDVVQQHVELLFALSVRDVELLDEIFDVYPRMEPSVQESIHVLLTPLIKSLGQTHTKLLTILRNFPPASENLAFRVLSILTDGGKPGPNVVALVKTLLIERDLDARFLIPIAAEMDKTEIAKYLPKIVAILCNQAPEKEMVRGVFKTIVTPPPSKTESSNQPREKPADQLLPADLLVFLHEDKSLKTKQAMEAIDICFAMPDLFPSEVFAVFMQRVIEEATLPMLFMRTVIKAATTYKSLTSFVASTLFPRLITKKIWTNPTLWKGFIACTRSIAPQSFGALLQLPRDQLRDLVEQQPGIKPALWQFLLGKAGKVKAMSYVDIFGEGMTLSSMPPQNQAIPTMG